MRSIEENSTYFSYACNNVLSSDSRLGGHLGKYGREVRGNGGFPMREQSPKINNAGLEEDAAPSHNERAEPES